MFGLSSQIRRKLGTALHTSAACNAAAASNISLFTNLKLNNSKRYFSYIPEGGMRNPMTIMNESYDMYQRMGINVARPEEISEEYMFLLREQREACDRMLVDMLPAKSQQELDAEIIAKLKDRAALMTQNYAEIYRNSRTKIMKQNPQNDNEIGPVYINPAAGWLGKTRHPDKPAFVVEPGNVAQYEKRLRGQAMFSDKSPQFVPQRENVAEDPLEARRRKRESRKLSPFMDKVMAHYALTKPRVSLMVTVTSWWGYFLVAENLNWMDFSLLTTGTLALSITASIINQIREIDVDARMARTVSRPLVTGKITPEMAKKIAAAYFVAGCALLTPISPIACALGVLNVGLYAGMYTSMKRTTALNTEMGAIVGAIPPVMGYFVGLPEGASWSHDLIALYWPAAVMFAWQMQHVMLICMRRAEDYNKSGLVMQCLNDPDLVTTRAKGVAWVILSTGIVAAPYFLDWSTISHIFMVYVWALYSGLYAKSALSNPPSQKGLLTCLYMGYILLGVTIALSLHAKKRDESKKYDYLLVNKKEKSL